MSNGRTIERIFDPLFEVALPSHMKENARNPKEDNGNMAKMGGKDLLIKSLLGHAIVAFKVMGCGKGVEDPTGGRILLQLLTKFWKFCRHGSK